MGLRDFIRKKDQLYKHDSDVDADTVHRLATGAPEFAFLRADTVAAEHDDSLLTADTAPRRRHHHRLRLSLRSRSASASSVATEASTSSGLLSPVSAGGAGDQEHARRRRLSQRLGLRRSPPSSDNVPRDLPEIQVAAADEDPLSPYGAADRDAVEAQWERRATILAQSRVQLEPERPTVVVVSVPGSIAAEKPVSSPGLSPVLSPVSSSPPLKSPIPPIVPLSPMSTFSGGDTPVVDNGRFKPFRKGIENQKPTPAPEMYRSTSLSPVSLRQPHFPVEPPPPSPPPQPPIETAVETAPETAEGRHTKAGRARGQAMDSDIQEAIRLHEAGELESSTRIFGRLADPSGANNPLAQVLYGLALRHGWGCDADPARAVWYLTQAAVNAAGVEEMALQAGLKKGGAAKGELVLAIFELANCFRHGWGIVTDPLAAKQYYETAANLGDTGAWLSVRG